MKSRKVVTFIGSREFKRVYMGQERDFIELSFIEHYGENYGYMSATKILTTVPKLRKALDYRGIKALEMNKRYVLWLSDYKGDRKLKFSGIQLWDGK